MIWLKLIKKLFKALNSDASPSEIAGAIVLGSIIGLTPVFALHNLFIFVLIIILKVNLSAAIFSAIIFSIIGYLLDPLSHIIGNSVLLSDILRNSWTVFYNTPVISLSRFNNTIVMGSLIISLIIAIPLFIFSKKFVVIYREKLQEKVQKFKLIKLFKASKIYNLYKRVKL